MESIAVHHGSWPKQIGLQAVLRSSKRRPDEKNDTQKEGLVFSMKEGRVFSMKEGWVFFMKWQFGSTSRKRRSSSSAWQGSEEMGSSQLHHAELLNPELLKEMAKTLQQRRSEQEKYKQGTSSSRARKGITRNITRYFVKQSSDR